MKNRFSEEQIIKILDEAQTGITIDEICRKNGVSRYSFYKWKSKYGGMTVPDVKKMKFIEIENSRLKKIVAEQALDIVALKDVLSRKW